jgi:hypothetical protein
MDRFIRSDRLKFLYITRQKYYSYLSKIKRGLASIGLYDQWKSNVPSIQKYVDILRGEILLDTFEVVKMIGWTDQYEDDLYYIVLLKHNRIELRSCVGGFTRLKNRLSYYQYQMLEELWRINDHTLEDVYNLALKKNLIIK